MEGGPMARTRVETEAARDCATCRRLLPGVSRTFSLAILGLKEPLRGAVCVSYLLCRILDTFEDAPGMSSGQRGEHIFPLLASLSERTPLPGNWVASARMGIEGASSENDLELVAEAPAVLRCLYACSPPVQVAVVRWVAEMGRGMVSYSSRMGEPGLKTLSTLAALDRYCYYIAGTVGYLLTDLFFLHSPHLDRERFYRLQENAEAFGLGLQKVNIIKDLSDDYRRGWCFIPGELLAREGLSPAHLADPAKAEPVYRAVRPVLQSTAAHLERGWRYLCAMPVEEKEIRLFLGYSLFFAAGTLALVAREPGRLVCQDEKLKISRMEVAAVVASVGRAISRPESLERLWRKTAAPLAAFAG